MKVPITRYVPKDILSLSVPIFLKLKRMASPFAVSRIYVKSKVENTSMSIRHNFVSPIPHIPVKGRIINITTRILVIITL